jgi:3-hydroxy acid dehydrogenase/malonic semialdehyde reductase
MDLFIFMKNILITGASSGIGQATAILLASQQHHIIACGRNREALQKLKAHYPEKITILEFDVRDKQAVKAAIASLNNMPIDVLINNAGNAHGLALFDEANLDDLEAMIDINVKGLIYVTKFVLPHMIPLGKGHIINISSIAGKQVYSQAATYCASKAAVEALTEGMRLDLLDKHIKVTGIAPGAVATNFSKVRFKGDETRAQKVYEGYTPLSAVNVAETIAYIISQPEHVQIADITLFPTAQASATSILRQ